MLRRWYVPIRTNRKPRQAHQWLKSHFYRATQWRNRLSKLERRLEGILDSLLQQVDTLVDEREVVELDSGAKVVQGTVMGMPFIGVMLPATEDRWTGFNPALSSDYLEGLENMSQAQFRELYLGGFRLKEDGDDVSK